MASFVATHFAKLINEVLFSYFRLQRLLSLHLKSKDVIPEVELLFELVISILFV